MPSSLRNSIHRRNHKERSQLAHRARLGILEKHKDYVQRARDYHSKQQRLTRLKQKAADRNKDEFYFSMTREKTQGGVHVKDRGNQALPVDIVKVLKTQDENYVRTMRSAGLKKIDKIKTQLMALIHPLTAGEELEEGELGILREAGITSGSKGKNKQGVKHIVFVDNDDEAKNYTQNSPLGDMNMVDAVEKIESDVDLGWKVPDDKKKRSKRRRPSGQDSNTETVDKQRGFANQHRQRLCKELSARLTRDRQLRYAEREFEMQRLLMGRGGRRKVRAPEMVDRNDVEDEDELDARKGRPLKGGGKVVDEKTWKPRVYKWKTERKR